MQKKQKKNGHSRDRTCDLAVNSRSLYRLSYTSTAHFSTCQASKINTSDTSLLLRHISYLKYVHIYTMSGIFTLYIYLVIDHMDGISLELSITTLSKRVAKPVKHSPLPSLETTLQFFIGLSFAYIHTIYIVIYVMHQYKRYIWT